MKLFTLLLVLSGLAFAQLPSRTIQVRGTGSITTLPDLGVITVEAIVISDKFADAVKGLNAKTEKLTAQLQMIGFKKDEIKTADFSVGKNIVWENGTSTEKGYIARQSLQAEFLNSKEKISALITSFMNSENDVRFSFHFTLSADKEKKTADEVLKRAVNDARLRAEVIAAAAQQKIGTVQNITYGSSVQRPVYQPAMYKTAAAESGAASGFDVKELTITDEVTIVWELK
jgi:uncharacterized protein YggE